MNILSRKEMVRRVFQHVIPAGMIIFSAFTACTPESSSFKGEKDSNPTTEPVYPAGGENAAGESPSNNQRTSDCLPEYDAPDEFLSIPAPAGLWGSRSADFNGDGWPDIVLWRGNFQTGNTFGIEFLLNDGSGNLKVGTSEILSGPAPTAVEGREVLIEDFNGDGQPDIFIADQGMDTDPWPGYQNTLVLSAPGGKMADATGNLPQQSDQTHSAAAADIEKDGDIDLFIGNMGGGGVSPQILINDGSGRFSINNDVLPREHVDLMQNWYTSSLFADINNDGFEDLILGQGDPNKNSHVLINDGTGNFSNAETPLPPSFFSPSQQVVDIQAGDIDGDGFLDLVLSETRSYYAGRYIQILVNNGDTTFTDETSTRLPQSENNDPWVIWINLVDLNMDDNLDIIASPMGDKEPLFFLNDGNGYFGPQENIFNIGMDNLFTFLDVNQDGLTDFFWSYPACDDGTCPETHFIVRSLGCK